MSESKRDHNIMKFIDNLDLSPTIDEVVEPLIAPVADRLRKALLETIKEIMQNSEFNHGLDDELSIQLWLPDELLDEEPVPQIALRAAFMTDEHKRADCFDAPRYGKWADQFQELADFMREAERSAIRRYGRPSIPHASTEPIQNGAQSDADLPKKAGDS